MPKIRGVSRIGIAFCGLLFMAACARSTTFTHRGSTGVAWYGPTVTDLGAMDPDLVSFATASPGTDRAVLDFRIEGNGSTAALVLSAHDGTDWRALGRTYEPYSLGGSGWAAAGSSFGLVDGGGGFNVTQLALGMNSDGDTFSVFGDSATAANTLNAGFASGDGWGADVPSAGATLTTAPVSADLAWDTSGTAYYAYVDNAAAPRLITYSAFSSWDLAANIVSLGATATQIGVRHDGYATQVVWRGDRPVRQLASFSAGGSFACAVTSQGEALCWGENGVEQLGDGTGSATDRSYPRTVSDAAGTGTLTNGVTQVSAGASHACAVYLGGAYCWGENATFQLSEGDGTVAAVPQTNPISIVGLSTNVAAVSAGGDFSCALDDDGLVFCWGGNSSGQVGDAGTGMTANESVPVQSDVTSTATAIATGSQHACAILSAGGAECWGEGSLGQIGNGATADTATPTAVTGFTAGTAVRSIVAGNNHSCALLSDTTVACWGSNASGQVGDNSTTDRSSAALVKSSAVTNLRGVTQLSASGDTTCAVTRAQVMYCWGSNANGQILGAAGASQTTALAIAGLQGAAAFPRVGSNFACATLTDGLTECWGANASGQLGHGSVVTPVTEPKLVSEQCVDATTASTGCAILAASDLDSYASVTPLSSALADDARNFTMAADGNGNTIVAFLQKNPAASACDTSTTPPTRNCDYRVYASFHSVAGVWVGPTQLDDPTLFPSTATTLYQDSTADLNTVAAEAAGGVEFPTPQVAHLGDGAFLAAFPLVDNSAGTSGLYARTYTAGSGWASATTTLESVAIDTDSAESYRVVNDLHLASDGNGSAILSTHVVLDADDNSDATLRSYGFRFYPYVEGVWQTAETTDTAYACAGPSVLPAPADYFCWDAKARGAVFNGGEATVVFPAPDEDDSTKLRLYEMEYR